MFVVDDFRECEPSSVWFVRRLAISNREQGDDFCIFWQTEFPTDCLWVKTFHWRRVQAIRLGDQHHRGNSNHGMTVDPHLL